MINPLRESQKEVQEVNGDDSFSIQLASITTPKPTIFNGNADDSKTVNCEID